MKVRVRFSAEGETLIENEPFYSCPSAIGEWQGACWSFVDVGGIYLRTENNFVLLINERARSLVERNYLWSYSRRT